MRPCLLLIWLLIASALPAQKSDRVIDSLEKCIGRLSDPNEIVTEKANLLLKYYTSGQIKKSQKLYAEALAEAVHQHSEPGMAMLLHTRGTLFYYESKYDSALAYFEKALALRKKINDHKGILKSTGNIGSIHFMLGNHKKALVYYDEALKKEAELHYGEGEFVSINNIGTIYNSLKMHGEAMKHFRKAEKAHTKNKAREQLIYTYDGMANVYKDLNEPDSALYYAFKARQICQELGETRSLSYAYLNIALFYKDLKDLTASKIYLDSALTIALSMSDKRLQLAAYGNLAAMELTLNRPDSAYRYIAQIIALQKELEIKNHRFELAEIFAKYYSEKGDFESAFRHLEMHGKYKDSLYNAEITRQISEMQAKYHSEKKEKENKLLQAENDSVKTTRNYLLIIVAIALAGIAGAVLAYRKIKLSNKLLHEQKAAIEQKNNLLEAQKKEIEVQKEIVDEKQKEILDSIHYARRIQFALLAGESLMQAHLPEHFVLFKPKDVVSGDFYWAAAVSDGFIYATADCTGHGVPGAFMSLLNMSKLSQVINENKVTRPDLVLNQVRTEIIQALNPGGSTEESKDGMDAILCKLNVRDMKLEFAAANNSFYVVRQNQLLHCKADKMPVGMGHDDSTPFTYNEFTLQKGDVIYTVTDGFADQFGGERGKKFKYKQLEELLVSIHTLSMPAQKQKLEDAFERWRGSLEQVDDICLIGVRV